MTYWNLLTNQKIKRIHELKNEYMGMGIFVFP